MMCFKLLAISFHYQDLKLVHLMVYVHDVILFKFFYTCMNINIMSTIKYINF
jgi:hypothetical protein